MNITFRQLELFLAIANEGNVTKAGKYLFLSQSAASMALAELETQLGLKVFDRIGKKLVLNQSGHSILPKANEILERVKEIKDSCAHDSKELIGTLKIGASTTVGNYLLPKVIAKFLVKYPKIKIQLDISNTEQIVDKLLRYKIDIAFIEDTCHESDIISTPWGNDKLVFFSSPSYWIASLKKINLDHLLKAHWILREQGSGTRRVFEKAVYPALNSALIYLELGSAESIKQSVMDGLGIGCLSKYTLVRELQAGDLIELPVKIFNIERNFYQLLHKEKYQTKALEAFKMECLNLDTIL